MQRAGTAEAAPWGRRAGRLEALRRVPDPRATLRRDAIRPDARPRRRQRLALGPPSSPTSAETKRDTAHRPLSALPGADGADTRGGRAPSRRRSLSEGRRALESAGRAGLSPSEPPEPSARAAAAAVPWSRASAVPRPSHGTSRLHRPAARPSTVPAARGERAAPPSSCGLGLPSAEGGGGGAVRAH